MSSSWCDWIYFNNKQNAFAPILVLWLGFQTVAFDLNCSGFLSEKAIDLFLLEKALDSDSLEKVPDLNLCHSKGQD